MFERLQQKWKAGPFQIVLILICFAVGGSLTGFSAKKIMDLLSVGNDWLWTIIYVFLLTAIWPLAVLFVSFFFGQFEFFKGYVTRLGQKTGMIQSSYVVRRSSQSGVQSSESAHSESEVQSSTFSASTASSRPALESELQTANSRLPTNIAIFASGAGSNAQKIIDHFRDSLTAKIALIVCNRKKAGVLQIAEKENIPFLLIEKEKFFSARSYLEELKSRKIDFVVLAGFLWRIPEALIAAFPRRIVNIHPALLPRYGGQGMYGNYVHEAVLGAGEKETGITIHYVDEHYDNGDIILQVRCPVLDGDTPESLAQRIHQLEYANYPLVIEQVIKSLRR